MNTAKINTKPNELTNSENELMAELIPFLYSKLKKMAHFQKLSFYDSDTLNTTALVHEAYLKLAKSSVRWQNELHFYALAGKAMREILMNYARAKMSKKRGQRPIPVTMDLASLELSTELCDELLTLENALTQLEKEFPREAKIVELRFFGGMTVEETASFLELSPATIKRSWQVARVWLLSEMKS